jgi:hypothetical protein
VFCLAALWLAAQSPEWQWAKQAGGEVNEWSNGIDTDSNGNSYITGYFKGTASFGSTILTCSGDSDIFVAKLDTYGNYLWVKQAGGTSIDWGYGIATDSSGNSYVTGCFGGTAAFGNTILTSSGYVDIFIAKLDTNGNWLWTKKAGGTSYDYGCSIAADSRGNSYVTGYFSDIANFGTNTLASKGCFDIFVAKLDTHGNWLWIKQAGGTNLDYGNGIATDNNGNSYVTGWFYDTATFGSTTLTGTGDADIFVSKLDNDGNWLWAKQAGGTGGNFSYGITTDSIGNSYVTGRFYGTTIFDIISLTSSGLYDILIAKLDSNGNWLWAQQAGGPGNDEGLGIVTDGIGNSYVTGRFYGIATFGSTTLTSSRLLDIFIAKLDSIGNWLVTMQAGGSSSDSGSDIATNSNGNCYVTGSFGNTATFGTTTLISSGDTDIFVAKISSSTLVSDEYGVPQPGFSLGKNHPNPFTNSTSFCLDVKDAKSVYDVSVYDLRGRHICTLHWGVLPGGMQTFTWNGKDAADNELSSGVYFYRVSNGKSSQVKKMIYVR